MKTLRALSVSEWLAVTAGVAAIIAPAGDVNRQLDPRTDIWIALAWCVGLLVVAYIFAMVIYRRKIS